MSSNVSDLFQIASGSVIGREHRLLGLNNQDAKYAVVQDNLITGFVADGCSVILGPRGEEVFAKSEVGANIGVRLVTNTVVQKTSQLTDSSIVTEEMFWERVRLDTLAQLRVLALQMGQSLTQVINEYFLFTLLGVLITSQKSVFVVVGDGIHIINEEVIRLGPFPDNQPPYFCHGINPEITRFKEDMLRFKIVKVMDTEDLESFAVGSDGVVALMENEESKLPGREEQVDPISQFWTDDLYFEESEALNLRLVLIAGDQIRMDWKAGRKILHPGLLHDDTTIVVGRRKIIA